MIPYDVDPSLHSTKPHEPVLDDGFSRPEMHGEKDAERAVQNPPPEPVLPEKSDF